MLRRSEEDTTEYLLNSPKNAARLREALEQSRRGEGIPFTMDDLRSELERGAHV
jgi:PHD/YefM family antitoxin component YafN of YafNO toxin-antitoxin module